MDKLKLLKILVAFLSFLLVFGILSAATIIYQKLKNNSANSPQNMQTVHLKEPFGSSINSMLEHNGYIYFLVKDGGKADRIVVFDPKTQQKVLRIVLE